jgi:hypothetical protein
MAHIVGRIREEKQEKAIEFFETNPDTIYQYKVTRAGKILVFLKLQGDKYFFPAELRESVAELFISTSEQGLKGDKMIVVSAGINYEKIKPFAIKRERAYYNAHSCIVLKYFPGRRNVVVMKLRIVSDEFDWLRLDARYLYTGCIDNIITKTGSNNRLNKMLHVAIKRAESCFLTQPLYCLIK